MNLFGGECGSQEQGPQDQSPRAVKRRRSISEKGGKPCGSLEMLCGGVRKGPVSVSMELTPFLSLGPISK